MKIKQLSPIWASAAGALFLSGIASAAPAGVGYGQFDITGSIYVKNSELSFGYAKINDDDAGILLPSEGAYGGLKAGEIARIDNLLTPAAGGPVTPGTPFLLPNWIQLNNYVNVNVDLTNISLNGNVPVCSGTAAAENKWGHVCRFDAQSPVLLEQDISGVTALLYVTGAAHYVGSPVDTPISGLLSANFTSGADSTISGLMADFKKNGSITTGYSGNFSTPSPEPASLSLIGGALFALSLLGRRKLGK
ncbi:MAG: hypothetical protein M3Y72_22670 [Acidobacteriota bacterium]|nr:hypothetical protein [Acidobacteriota bacterium]